MTKVTHLRCNDDFNVLGIQKPYFSWWLESDERNVTQYRYYIQVALDEMFEDVIWDYKRHSDETTGIPYMGPALESRTRYFVRVMAWTAPETATEWSETIWFETPFMDKGEWTAKWIKPEITEVHGNKDYRRPYIACKEFSLKGNVKKARLYITCLGVYFAELNGKRVGDDYFRPGYTDYNYRVQYQTYDVGGLLNDKGTRNGEPSGDSEDARGGNNVLKVTVAEGWFSGYFGWEGRKNTYGSSNALLAQLEVEYEDGTKETVKTDGTWTQNFGEILYSDFYNGEFCDHREEEKQCGQMQALNYPKTTLVPQEGPSVKNIMKITPAEIFKDTSGQLILDMGQNMVGWIRFRNANVKDNTLRLYHGEVLDKDGNFYNENLRKADAADIYIVEPNDGKWYEPHFTFHGFRYVKLEGFTEDIRPEDFEGIVLSSGMEQICDFHTANDRINRLQSNILWGQRDNFVDIPTDCPQRDERLGWTADAQIILLTAAFDFHVNRFFRKWLRDLESGQMEQGGAAPYVVPDILKGVFSDGQSNTTAAWGDAAVTCPWELYQAYGDKSVLEEQYSSMKAWIDYIRREGDNEYLWDTGVQLADWLGLDSEEDSFYGATDGCLAATAYYAYSTGLFAEAARVVGNMSDHREYKGLYENIRRAFYENFVGEDVKMSSHTQTAYVLALQFGLLDKEDEKRAAEHLVRLVHENNDHLNTGFLGTPFLCHVLTDHGYTDLAYKLLFNDDFPSWLYQVDNGATTMWEHWDSRKVDGSFWSTEMNSFNHYAYGSIGSWMYRAIGGLGLKSPGYKKSVIAPKPEARIGAAKCTLTSARGPISCEWRLDGRKLTVTAQIPANTRAFIMLPEPEDRAELEAQVQKITDKKAVYTDGKVPQLTDVAYDVEYRVARDYTEKEIHVENEVAFETGSGTYTFEYVLKSV